MLKVDRRVVATVSMFAVAGFAPVVQAQEYPSKHVTLVMPYAAGGPGDVLTRILAQGLSTALKQQFIVENVAGAGGTIGSAKVSGASPDGYTLLINHISAATNPALYPKLKYDKFKDFEAIGLVAELPSVFVGRKDLPAASFADLIAYVKANDAKVNYAHAGIGSASHLCGLLFASSINASLSQVPYRGSGPAMNDLVGGQVDFICDQTVNVMGNAAGGLIKPYAVTSKSRAAVLANVPTVAEAGLPGFELTIWYGMWASKGTPKPVVDKLVAGLNAALVDPLVKEKLAALGAQTVSADRAQPAALNAHVAAETAKWGPIIKKAGVTAAQ